MNLFNLDLASKTGFLGVSLETASLQNPSSPLDLKAILFRANSLEYISDLSPDGLTKLYRLHEGEYTELLVYKRIISGHGVEPGTFSTIVQLYEELSEKGAFPRVLLTNFISSDKPALVVYEYFEGRDFSKFSVEFKDDHKRSALVALVGQALRGFHDSLSAEKASETYGIRNAYSLEDVFKISLQNCHSILQSNSKIKIYVKSIQRCESVPESYENVVAKGIANLLAAYKNDFEVLERIGTFLKRDAQFNEEYNGIVFSHKDITVYNIIYSESERKVLFIDPDITRLAPRMENIAEIAIVLKLNDEEASTLLRSYYGEDYESNKQNFHRVFAYHYAQQLLMMPMMKMPAADSLFSQSFMPLNEQLFLSIAFYMQAANHYAVRLDTDLMNQDDVCLTFEWR
jgi:thiamine kinase-like enzyme